MIIQKGDKIVGEIVGNIFYTERKTNHFMFKFQGFGISTDIIKRLVANNIEDIIITYYGKNTIKYKVKLSQYINSKKIHVYSTEWNNYEEDEQRFVSVKDMEILE